MGQNDLDEAQLTGIIALLAELHEWELTNAPLLSTLTGRHLYFRMAQRAVGDREHLSRALKDLTSGAGYTEKALRMRMRDMERDGYTEALNGLEDGRSKYLMPTEKFYQELYSHAAQVKQILRKNYLLIQK